MKTLITILFVMMIVVGCRKREVEKMEPEQRKLTAEEKIIIGTYREKDVDDNMKMVFLENGVVENYIGNTKKKTARGGTLKWSIASNKEEVYIEESDGFIGVFRIQTNGDLNMIAYIKDGMRRDVPKENQSTLEKLK